MAIANTNSVADTNNGSMVGVHRVSDRSSSATTTRPPAMVLLVPKCSTALKLMRAPTGIPTANASISAPASSALLPSTNCRYWVSPKIIPNMAKKVSAMPPAPAVKRRLRKRERSSIGACVCVSRQAKARASTTAAPKHARISGSVQPSAGPSMIPYTSAPTAPIERTAIVNGTLMRNTEPHQKWASRAPPMSGPNAPLAPATAAHAPMARPRSFGSWKTLVSSDNVEGMISAPPIPIATRTAMRWPMLVASGAVSDEAPKMMRPACRALARPKRSPSAPIVRSRPAKTRTYASTIHCRSDALAWKVRWMVGRATFSTVLSSPISTKLRQRTPRVHHLRA